jgi:hypothetical protein
MARLLKILNAPNVPPEVSFLIQWVAVFGILMLMLEGALLIARI